MDKSDTVKSASSALSETSTNGSNFSKKPRTDPNTLSTRQYLDQTVAPILLHGLQAVARDRPADPLSYLAAFLLKNKSKCEETVAEN